MLLPPGPEASRLVGGPVPTRRFDTYGKDSDARGENFDTATEIFPDRVISTYAFLRWISWDQQFFRVRHE